MTNREQHIPVHLLSGFLGSGKTTLLRRLLDYYTAQGMKPAVIMNELGDINLDGQLVGDEVPMAEMLSGCICCTMRGDLGMEISMLIDEHKPDVIFIDLENPNRDMMEHLFQLTRTVSRPIAMFVDRSDTASIEAAVEAGVSAYVVDGLKKERVKPILDMAVSRFNAFSRLQRELADAKSALEERKVVERAKGILMKMRGLSEEQAFALLRQTAMNEKKKISEIAQSVVTAAGLLM